MVPHTPGLELHACTHNYSSFSLSFFLPTFSYIIMMTTLCAVFCLPTGLSLSNTIRAISADPLLSSPWSFLHPIPFVASLLTSVHPSSEPQLLTPNPPPPAPPPPITRPPPSSVPYRPSPTHFRPPSSPLHLILSSLSEPSRSLPAHPIPVHTSTY
jgi:hypothetical protein